MGQENVEVVRRAFEEFSRGGWEPLMGTYWSPNVLWDMTPTGIPGLGIYRGYDELRGRSSRIGSARFRSRNGSRSWRKSSTAATAWLSSLGSTVTDRPAGWLRNSSTPS